MKRILLQRIPDPRNPGDESMLLDYRSTIEQVVRLPKDRQSGATIDEMRKGIRVLDALDASEDDILVLEDADWTYLKDKVEIFPWGMVDRRLVRFYDDIVGATDAIRSPQLVDGRT